MPLAAVGLGMASAGCVKGAWLVVGVGPWSQWVWLTGGGCG